jgi:hypothetical protein
LDIVAVSTRKPPAGSAVAIKPQVPTGIWNNEPTKLVCAALALAILTLAIRIASVW